MTKKQALISEIQEAFISVGAKPGRFSLQTSTSKYSFPITVKGRGIMHEYRDDLGAELIYYLKGLGWREVEADRSGIFLRKDRIIVRFCE